MIHGGGYMTLSKRAVRPHQTQYLLDHGYLPVSIDYRLCPEIDLISGPMTDVRDALEWVRNKLPAIARARGVRVDPTKTIAIGWSTGGHLALTTAWTCGEIGQKPPVAILCFYGPTNFESDGALLSNIFLSLHVMSSSVFRGGHCVSPLLLKYLADIDRRRAEQYPERSMSLDEIRESLPAKPVSHEYVSGKCGYIRDVYHSVLTFFSYPDHLVRLA